MNLASPFHAIMRTRAGLAAAASLGLVAAAALFGPLFAASPLEQDLGAILHAPEAAHLIGTDHLGRDLLSRALHGTRASLAIGFEVGALAGVSGGLLGLVSGYRGGVVDLLVQRLIDALMAIPLLVLALALIAARGPSGASLVIALGLAFAPLTLRVTRASALSLKWSGYAEAARAMGSPGAWIVLRHILPNAAGPWLVVTGSQIGSAILAESALSFVGLGVPEPLPSLGGMLGGQAQTYMHVAPWIVAWPGIILFALVLSVNLLGDAMAESVATPSARGLTRAA